MLLTSLTTSTKAQYDDELYIFGFSQVLLNTKSVSYNVYESDEIPFAYGNRFNSTSFALHQVNLFFQKPINERSIFFLNLEATGSYSSKIPSGHLEIPEGWISYRFSELLEIKAGLLLPKFNNLTEIKNRLPLFPYLIRPIMYESLLNNLVTPEDYNPQNAYFQITGSKQLLVNKYLEYAFYIGNAENSFLSRTPVGSADDEEAATAFYLGENMNTALLFGGRLGLINQYETFKTGVSFTYDEDNRTEEVTSIFRLSSFTTPILGEVKRYRFGYDLSFTLDKIAFEGEFISVFHNHKEIRENPAFAQANLNKYFVYANLTYNFNDDFYAFGYSSFHQDQSFEMVKQGTPSAAGVLVTSFGGGWRPFENTSIKVQYLDSYVLENNYLGYTIDMLSVGISTIF